MHNTHTHSTHHRYMIMIHVFIMVLTLAIFTQTEVPYNRVAIDFGFAKIYWYAVFILTGLLLAAFFSQTELVKMGYSKDFLYDGLLWGVPIALLGARLYYVMFDPIPHYNSFFDIINISKGGLAIHGALIATFIFLPIYSKLKKVNVMPIVDILVMGFLIGQIVGRFGNFMNHEAYGPAIQSEWIIRILPNFILNQMRLGDVIHHPTFLYEGLWNLVFLIFLITMRQKRVFKIGDYLGLYLIWYGLGRGLIIEPMRVNGAYGDALMFMNVPINIAMSFVFILIGIGYMLIKHRHRHALPFQVDTYIENQERTEN
ncbi:prolipoprotein diacylglyceryl transferase [Peloplasma aerotolerans]|uniref:Phosphatidylglycerol--prolipoprotein diacylglyceryl transferase n=1 Tax=Peloplasma aerotolerans TaxID=3044389 RepID=A0AAW6U4F8_9MOLU|nr:prolipoprotein diacylglyceryl transferase [Mariniplasma sp. M4Ah]MDI6452856.1 prolipoprotein diacylglyceryl transferase [Mariniplasma sp. M4Ah]